ncbi:alpha/beta hydrolase [Haloglycomyces albus]|uniref:alpha/beta hydrolase n=1 Tax=Haloglycomyces albus TaxID=526067 RepID=UPI00046CDDE3|nr:alpha/beta hydrolase [Haloglycomyces albus]
MSELNWETFRNTDFSSLGDFAAVLKKYIGECEETEDRVFKDNPVFGDDDSDDFAGDTADETRAFLDRTVSRYLDNTEMLDRIVKLLAGAEDDLSDYQSDLEDLFETAGTGLTPTGKPGKEEFVINGRDSGGIDKPDDPEVTSFRNWDIDDHCEEMSIRFRELMENVRDLDDDIDNNLSSLDDDLIDLPPTLAVADYESKTRSFLENELDDFTKGEEDPDKVHDWWNALSEENREWMIENNYEQIGPLNGIPSNDRDSANRLMLDLELNDPKYDDLDQLDELRDKIERMDLGIEEKYEQEPTPRNGMETIYTEEYLETREKIERLEKLERDYANLNNLQDKITSNDDSFLLKYDTDETNGAVVAIGNPDEKDNVGVLVPGTNSSMDNADRYIDNIATIEDQVSDDTSVVLWMDYDAPDDVEEAFWADRNESGHETLNDYGKSIDTTNTNGSDVNLTYTGHSYGGFLIGEAAANDSEPTPADNLVFVAASGSGNDVNQVHDYEGIDEDNMWSTMANGDSLGLPSGLIGHGSDPTTPSFEAETFESDSLDRNGNPSNEGNKIHTGYFAPENQAVKEIARIMSGNPT